MFIVLTCLTYSISFFFVAHICNFFGNTTCDSIGLTCTHDCVFVVLSSVDIADSPYG